MKTLSTQVSVWRAHHRQDLAGDPGSIVRSKEQHSIRDVLRGAHPAHGDAFDKGFLALGSPSFPLRFVVGTGAQEPGRHGVHRDAELPELMGYLPHQPELAVLGRLISLD